MARGMGQLGNGDSNDQLIDCNGAMAIAIAMALGQGHWGTGATDQCCNGNGATIDRMIVLSHVVLQRKTSTIVVDETVQNVWTANIREVLRSNRTSRNFHSQYRKKTRKWS
jgi:hypothetical protein